MSTPVSTPSACRTTWRAEPPTSCEHRGPPGEPAALFRFPLPLIPEDAGMSGRGYVSAFRRPSTGLAWAHEFRAPASPRQLFRRRRGDRRRLRRHGRPDRSGGSGDGRVARPDHLHGHRPVPGHRPARRGAELATEDAGRAGLVDAGGGPAGGLDAGPRLVDGRRRLRHRRADDGADRADPCAGSSGRAHTRRRRLGHAGGGAAALLSQAVPGVPDRSDAGRRPAAGLSGHASAGARLVPARRSSRRLHGIGCARSGRPARGDRPVRRTVARHARLRLEGGGQPGRAAVSGDAGVAEPAWPGGAEGRRLRPARRKADLLGRADQHASGPLRCARRQSGRHHRRHLHRA